MDMLLGVVALTGYAVVMAAIIMMYYLAFLFLLATMVVKNYWEAVVIALVCVSLTFVVCYVVRGL